MRFYRIKKDKWVYVRVVTGVGIGEWLCDCFIGLGPGIDVVLEVI